MGFLGKKDQRNMKKLGNKALKKTSLGLKAGGRFVENTASVTAPILSVVASAVAEQPIVISEKQVKAVGGIMKGSGQTIEKLRKGDNLLTSASRKQDRTFV